MYLMVGNVLLIMCGLFVAATSAAMVRHEIGATWLGWAGLAIGDLQLIAPADETVLAAGLAWERG